MSIKQKISVFSRYLPSLFCFLLIIWAIISADIGTQNIVFTFIKSIPHGDKIAHFFLYGILTFLFNIALGFRALRFKHYQGQWGAIMVFLFAIVEEISQYFFPNRTLSLADVIADGAGIGLFTYFSLKLQQAKLSKIKFQQYNLKK